MAASHNLGEFAIAIAIFVCSETGGGDGDCPDAGVILDATGKLYGTTNCGGAQNNGSVFEINAVTGTGGVTSPKTRP
jgi:uncharacterized repeat protein (TIGR03803 family)